jgi:hypothetical protein
MMDPSVATDASLRKLEQFVRDAARTLLQR